MVYMCNLDCVAASIRGLFQARRDVTLVLIATLKRL